MTSCHACRFALDDEGSGEVASATVVDGLQFCSLCACEHVERTRDAEFKAWAVEHVRVTRTPHEYDPTARHAPTREEYEMGMHEAYTENSVRADNRHNCTNYDDLIRDLNRDDPLDRAKYNAIRRQVEALVGDVENGGLLYD
jgi:hypothetical protein